MCFLLPARVCSRGASPNPLLRVKALEKAELSNQAVYYTHPDIATLVDPLFSFAGKRVKEMFPCSFALYPFFAPLSAAGEERVVQRSVGRVSLHHHV